MTLGVMAQKKNFELGTTKGEVGAKKKGETRFFWSMDN